MSTKAIPFPSGTSNTQHGLLLSLGTALHDLSQPLTSVVFAIELSGLDDDDVSRRAMLASARTECNRVLEQVARMRVLCEELLAYQHSRQGVA